MKKNIFLILSLAAMAFSVTSCLDYDNPGDEIRANEGIEDDVVFHGNPDQIRPNTYAMVPDSFKVAQNRMKTYLGKLVTAQYYMRGGKEGNPPAEHAYQWQYTIYPDNLAGYSVVPHNFNGKLKSTYSIAPEFVTCAEGSGARNNLTDLLNHPDIDSIPEIKAWALLLYNYSTAETVNTYGPMPYTDYKNNVQSHPYKYESVDEIYYKIVENIDSIVACFNEFDSKPDWYKKNVGNIFAANDYMSDMSVIDGTDEYMVETWRRFANSFKLRMAMHVVKVEPATARKWAEEAVADGVIEKLDQEKALRYDIAGFINPLSAISESWNDTRLNAQFETLLFSLNHPYSRYLYKKNSDQLINEKNPSEIMEANTRVVGIRAGVKTIPGQSSEVNPRIGYSRYDTQVIGTAPLYYMKLSEVDFLRAEGAIRGWNMGGTAQFFYERGIENSYLEPRNKTSQFTKELSDYMSLESAIPYQYVDPMDHDNDAMTPTTIGVKWNEGDDLETKLEKIITQKYISLFPDSYEAWTELRRTGYPKLLPVLRALDSDGSLYPGDLMRRLPFPNTADDNVMSDVEATGIPALGNMGDLVGIRLWWDPDVPNF